MTPAKPHGRSAFVDYDRAADVYRAGRGDMSEVLRRRWAAAIARQLAPAGVGRWRVADVGAGTGVFMGLWQGLGAEVVAVELAAAMIRAAGGGREFVQGAAESLPLRDASVDVVWMSTAFHHFADQAAAVAEARRVLHPGGRVLIRTHLPDRTSPGWLGAFPGHERSVARFPRLAELIGVFSPLFALVAVDDVNEGPFSFGASADWAERMRHADSGLTALTDSEIADGLAALRADPDRMVDFELSLITFAVAEP